MLSVKWLKFNQNRHFFNRASQTRYGDAKIKQPALNAHWFEKMSQVCYVPQLYELPPASSSLTGSVFYQYQPQLQSLPHTAVDVRKMQLAIKSLLIPF
jgi:hypothetical protein